MAQNHAIIDPLDQPEINMTLRTLAQAKGMLTRRTRAFVALIDGHVAFTRQQLVAARGEMVTACDNMVVELDHYEQLGFPLDNPHYLDGRTRQTQCMDYYGTVYHDHLQNFNDLDSHAGGGRSSIRSRPPASEHSLGSFLANPISQSLAPSLISSQAAASLRDELHREELQQNAALEREQRAQQRRLRADAIEREIQREREAAEMERELQARQARQERELQARQARQLEELRQQELADEAAAAAEALQAQQRRNRDRLEAALSSSGRSGAGSNRQRSRAGSTRSRRPSLRSVLARSVAGFGDRAASHASQDPDLLLDEPLIRPPAVNNDAVQAAVDQEFVPLPAGIGQQLQQNDPGLPPAPAPAPQADNAVPVQQLQALALDDNLLPMEQPPDPALPVDNAPNQQQPLVPVTPIINVQTAQTRLPAPQINNHNHNNQEIPPANVNRQRPTLPVRPGLDLPEIPEGWGENPNPSLEALHPVYMHGPNTQLPPQDHVFPPRRRISSTPAVQPILQTGEVAGKPVEELHRHRLQRHDFELAKKHCSQPVRPLA